MKVLVADGVSQKAVDILQKNFDVVIKDKLPAEELLEIIPEFDGVIVRSASKITKEVIDKAANLKVIGRAGVGTDNIDIPAATERGIIVLNAPEGNTIAATEHTMAMMLSMSRMIPIANETLHKGEWNRKKYVGVELRGKTLGVIGLGRIGSGVAKRAMSFDMKIIAYDPYLNEDRAQALGVKIGTLDDVVKNADFITVHMPLTPQTKNMLNKDNIAKMKKGIRLVNCARGGIINEQDLADGLKSGQIAAAAIDVFTSEPLAQDNPLASAPNIVLTPHLGASTVEAQIGVAIDASNGVAAALKGEPVSTAVNMAPVSAETMGKIRPYLTLAERLGCTAQSLSDGPIQSLTIQYNGDIADIDTKMMTIAVIKGVLNPILQTAVNYVNAPSIAKQRNIKIQEIKNKDVDNFANLITVTLKTSGGEQSVQGALFGTEGRIVTINQHRVDVDPHARILICPHINRPGMIGHVGSLLAKYNINISGMQVGKTAIAGTSIMVLTIDDDITQDIIDQVSKIDGIFGAKLVNYYTV
ncbi:phosphoglycerate dehydrogenase [Pectinatus haikarae]|uniref:D-3-phosphoglycerate dehydrogenase n=1 Tax=Pectinatus haikarae TaxID=349096 RepID=A0ABT9YBX8_9FIRM|nr:phosphoglycerate dehydrogenase [Pectinatus haikarae]MDQ0205036.1 D-3-phosphoglycerate dehydrogenase [Pectinatus haikarae]